MLLVGTGGLALDDAGWENVDELHDKDTASTTRAARLTMGMNDPRKVGASH